MCIHPCKSIIEIYGGLRTPLQINCKYYKNNLHSLWLFGPSLSALTSPLVAARAFGRVVRVSIVNLNIFTINLSMWETNKKHQFSYKSYPKLTQFSLAYHLICHKLQLRIVKPLELH